jgi:heme/copper-type cytochrome/quinol oxidase subunit 2
MPYSILYILIIIVALIGGVGTFMVGYSKANKQANSEYTKKTTANLKKLSLFYIIITIASIVSFIIYLYMRD